MKGRPTAWAPLPLLWLAAVSLLLHAASAQSWAPQRHVELVVPGGAGGSLDGTGRDFIEALKRNPASLSIAVQTVEGAARRGPEAGEGKSSKSTVKEIDHELSQIGSKGSSTSPVSRAMGSHDHAIYT